MRIRESKPFVLRLRFWQRLGVALGVLVLLGGLHAQTSKPVIHDPRAYEGFTLIAPMTSTSTFLIYNSGQVVHSWLSKFAPAMSVYLLADGSILRPAALGPRANSVFRAGGAAGRLERFGWDGALQWEFEYSSDRFLTHHDVEPLPNGNVLAIAWELRTAEEAVAAGRDPELLPDGVLWPDSIVEFEPVGSSGARIVWEWRIWDHLIQDFDPTKANFGAVADHPELVDLNFFEWDATDWNHMNSVDYNAERDEIVLCVRGFNEIWVIDHSTTTEEAASHAGGKSGKGGDLLYRWGNPRAYRAGTAADLRLHGPHDARWIEPGLPGGRNITVFDNGARRPEGRWSSIVEIIPPYGGDGAYTLAPEEAYGPVAPVWEYTDPIPTEFFSTNISGAQRLPNGNTLISSGANGVLFEVTPGMETVWKLVVGFNDLGRNIFFRADRYGLGFPGFVGKNLAGDSAALVNAASYRIGPAAPASIVTAFGAKLAGTTNSAVSVPLPEQIDDTTVEVTDGAGVSRLAALFYISAEQVNFQIPPETAIGPATISIRSGADNASSAAVWIEAVAPGLFTASGTGEGPGLVVALRIDAEGNRTTVPALERDPESGELRLVPIDLGAEGDQTYLLLFGTGIRGFNDAESIAVTIDGEAAPVLGAAAQEEFTGLDQVNVGPISRELAGRGEVSVVLTVDGKNSNSVLVSF